MSHTPQNIDSQFPCTICKNYSKNRLILHVLSILTICLTTCLNSCLFLWSIPLRLTLATEPDFSDYSLQENFLPYWMFSLKTKCFKFRVKTTVVSNPGCYQYFNESVSDLRETYARPFEISLNIKISSSYIQNCKMFILTL